MRSIRRLPIFIVRILIRIHVGELYTIRQNIYENADKTGDPSSKTQIEQKDIIMFMSIRFNSEYYLVYRYIINFLNND